MVSLNTLFECCVCAADLKKLLDFPWNWKLGNPTPTRKPGTDEETRHRQRYPAPNTKLGSHYKKLDDLDGFEMGNLK